MTLEYTAHDHLGSARPEPGRYPHHPQPANTSQFRDFYSRYFTTARNIAAARCGASAIGEDIANEVMVSMWERWKDVESGKIGNPDAYATTVLKNLIAKHHEQTARQAKLLPMLVEPDPQYEPAERTAVSNIEVDNLIAILQTALTEKQREAFVCRAVMGMSTDEIAGRMKMSSAAVRKTVTTAADKLKARWVPRPS